LWRAITDCEQQRTAADAAASRRRTRRKSDTKDPEREDDPPAKNPPSESEPESKPEKRKERKKKAKEDQPAKARKIRLYPTVEMKQRLLQRMGTVRWTYNQCLDAVLNKGKPWQAKALRAACVNDNNFKGNPDMAWVLKTPYDTRDEGMRDLLKAYEAQMAKRKLAVQRGDTPEAFRVRFRSAKAPTQTLVVHAKHWRKARTVYISRNDIDGLRPHEPLPRELAGDCRILRTRWGKWYFVLCQPLEVRRENQASQQPECDRHEEPSLAGVAAIDPGVRTFNSVYGAGSGAYYEWAIHDFKRIARLGRATDKLQPMAAQRAPITRHRERYRYRRAADRIRNRVRDLVDDLHKRMTKWLVERYRVVLLPKFDTQDMVCKSRCYRRIGSRTARSMLTWSHYRFRQRLLAKTREYPWCKMLLVDEAYTSRTCGRCGHAGPSFASKTFRCRSSDGCDFVCDRDLNGARNILLRYLTESGLAP
jgi:putative transposase